MLLAVGKPSLLLLPNSAKTQAGTSSHGSARYHARIQSDLVELAKRLKIDTSDLPTQDEVIRVTQAICSLLARRRAHRLRQRGRHQFT